MNNSIGREIPNKNGVIVVVHNGKFDAVYRRKEGALHYRASCGIPGDASEFFNVPADMTDEYIVTLVEIYERGHERGWLDGQWQLRHDIKDMLHIRQD